MSDIDRFRQFGLGLEWQEPPGSCQRKVLVTQVSDQFKAGVELTVKL
jgi:hypothetical protein